MCATCHGACDATPHITHHTSHATCDVLGPDYASLAERDLSEAAALLLFDKAVAASTT